VLAVAALLVVGVGVAVLVGGPADPTDPASTARTTFPDLVPATSEPTLPALETLAPAPGTVVQAPGPFDDRFRLRGLTFASAAVSGSVEVTSDVSDLLELEVLAGFYDRDGVLLATARAVHHLDESTAAPGQEGPPEETYRFRIRVPADAEGAVSAAVGVPVLVNE